MKKSDIVEHVASRESMTKRAVVAGAVFVAISEPFGAGEDMTVMGVGRIFRKTRRDLESGNPRIGELAAGPSGTVSFKPVRAPKDALG